VYPGYWVIEKDIEAEGINVTCIPLTTGNGKINRN
jgi:hypothetical protein